VLLRKFDADKDGSLSFEELKKMVHQCKKREKKPSEVEMKFIF